ncbi:MAG: DUF1549 domain-containing protein [Gemmataceae bacterium]
MTHAVRCLALSVILSVAGPIVAGNPPRAEESARQVDLLFQGLLGERAAALTRADDASFYRRLSLDLTGKLPAPEDLRRFAEDAAPDKRAKLIDQLLDSKEHAVNWGRYWRDVLTYHTPASGNYLRWQLFDQWWTEQIARNRPWDDIVTALVTATGVNDEVAPVNYLTALYGNPVEIASTTSRVFLGVQIQCAECHNAKTEPWKREQFHELAAFFGRAKLVQHKDVTGRGTPYAIEGRSSGQYQMVSKRDPSRGLEMQPRFLTGESIDLDASDDERRAALARLITSPNNPWFAKCYVNRMWSRMLGWGFYPSVADLGGHDTPRFTPVLKHLEKDFIASGHDMRWLFRTIALTRAYQASLQPPPRSDDGLLPAVCPVRLRGEQVFEALQASLGFDENDKDIAAPAPKSSPAVQRHTGLRNMVYQAFKVNPSLPFDEVQGTIPQALVMMNSELVHRYTSAKGNTLLAGLLSRALTDDEILAALYERVLARKPTAHELTVCRNFIAKTGNRAEALEDILWSLVNSTEFLLKK